MAQYPAEFVGGPWDGRLEVVARPQIQISIRHHPQPLCEADKQERVPIRTGLYAMRIVDGQIKTSPDGNYYFDWRGWD